MATVTAETIESENLTRTEAAAFLRCGLVKLWSLEKEGLLMPSFRIGRRPIYRKKDVQRFCDSLAKKQRAAKGSR